MNEPTLVPEGAAVVWGADLHAAGCPKCARVHLVPAARASGPCPACFAANLTPQPARLRAEPPEMVVPFQVNPDALTPRLEAWAKTIWLRPSGLSPAALRSRLTPGYLPMWLVDAQAEGSWQAQVGFDYEVASAKEHFQDGRWNTQHVKEVRIRWEPRAGQVRRPYINTAAPALDDHAALMNRLGAFPQAQARPYDPAAASGAVVRLPSLDPAAAWPFARARLDERVTADVQAAVGAQHTDDVTLSVAYSQPHWTQLLLPIYTSAYQDDDGAWQPVLVNGATGQVSGARRASQRLGWRYTGLIALGALALFVLSLILSGVGLLFPPLIALGGLVLIVSLLAALLAPIPAVWAWQFNRGQN